jgi:hypothetical protein
MSQTCILKHTFKEANYFIIMQPMHKYFQTILGYLDTDLENVVHHPLKRRSPELNDYYEEYFSLEKINHSFRFIHSIQTHSYQKLPNEIVIKLVRFEYSHLNYIVKKSYDSNNFIYHFIIFIFYLEQFTKSDYLKSVHERVK